MIVTVGGAFCVRGFQKVPISFRRQLEINYGEAFHFLWWNTRNAVKHTDYQMF